MTDLEKIERELDRRWELDREIERREFDKKAARQRSDDAQFEALVPPEARRHSAKPRITQVSEIVMAGRVIGKGVTPEMIAAERVRLGVNQLSNKEIIGLHKRLLGNPPMPSPEQVCKDAGATLDAARRRGWR